MYEFADDDVILVDVVDFLFGLVNSSIELCETKAGEMQRMSSLNNWKVVRAPQHHS
jgi:hypothetical protein